MTKDIAIRNEEPCDLDTITQLTKSAFESKSFSSHTEHFIINALRRADLLTISLVALVDNAIVGHVAISPVTISSGISGWYGLGPISVSPEHQGQGIGSKLMTASLAELQHLGGLGCVLLGNPAFYGRFGFKAHPSLVLDGVPPEYFQVLSFGSDVPSGTVHFHEAFNATS
ncbi:hypothetical protein BGZ97_008060 [Linnemannia gamsii]|uniref:N-acetyltransferase domain-containing protein n=1 Tax=Linnemannia gamsii TaxID=64522 RepID=A0A9P6UR36_9FUNG|nr:hypothetical protein BGZ97_008060 [Linnemannia gamsii]